MAKPILTLERLKELLSYNPEDGSFTWLVSRGPLARPGKRAGTVKDRYEAIVINQRRYYVHRLVWLFTTGAWPKDMIDHIDGDKRNNRFKNLREATRQQNSQNIKRANRNNESGLLGACRARKKWTAKIKIGDKNECLGPFSTPEEAHLAYIEAKRKLHEFGDL